MIYTQLVLLLAVVVGVMLQHCFKIYAANASHLQ